MRERYLEAFDAIRIDCLNGDKYKTGKVAPDGTPDPSVFSTPSDPVGIQVGTAIATLVRKAEHAPAETIGFRHLWGQAKREELLETAGAEPTTLYEAIEPVLPMGLPLIRTAVSEDYFDWPTLPELFPQFFAGVVTGRDSLLIDTDLDRLRQRVSDHFDVDLGHEEIARRYPRVMETTARFNAHSVRDSLLKRGGPVEAGFVRHAYRPFDNRWLYWEAETKLVDEKRADYWPHVFKGNLWLVAQKRSSQEWEPAPVITHISNKKLLDFAASCFPTWLQGDDLNSSSTGHRPNLSVAAQRYLDHLDLGVEDLFHHVLAVLYDPTYREDNTDALRMDWPRIPLPDWPAGDAKDAAETLARSAARGHELAALLDPDTSVPGVTTGTLRPEVAAIAIPATVDGRNMDGNDFALTAGWGHYGTGEAVMPGQGRVVEREYTPDERATLVGATHASPLHSTTFDIYLNGNAYWRNVPAAVWRYKLGGYQVLKKWLSYRERAVLGRALVPEEVLYFAEVARRIRAIVVVTDTPAVSDYTPV